MEDFGGKVLRYARYKVADLCYNGVMKMNKLQMSLDLYQGSEFRPEEGEWVMTPRGPGRVAQVLRPDDPSYAPDDGDDRSLWYCVYWRSYTREWFKEGEIGPYSGERKFLE